MKVNAPFSIAAAACCYTATAFQHNACHLHSISSSSHRSIILGTSSSSSSSCLLAKKKKDGSSSGSGKGFGAKKDVKYSINDKSYDIKASSTSTSSSSTKIEIDEQSLKEAQSSTTDFFSTYSDWHPLFRNIMNTNLASSFLQTDNEEEEDIWGMSTLENRNPWRLLPAKPTTNSSLGVLSNFLDEWQQSLLDIPLDSVITGDNDLHFLEEGRRTIAVGRFHVLDSVDVDDSDVDNDDDDWEKELFRTCWSELAHLTSQDEVDTGSLILLPNTNTAATTTEEEEDSSGVLSLDHVKHFVEQNLIQPIRAMGREGDWEIVAMERGSLAVRLLYKLSDMPDLAERDSGGDGKLIS